MILEKFLVFLKNIYLQKNDFKPWPKGVSTYLKLHSICEKRLDRAGSIGGEVVCFL